MLCPNCHLLFYSPLITGDEIFYNSLQKFPWYYQSEKSEYIFAKKFISNLDNVIEIGSGKGAFLKHIKPKSYLGLDNSERAIELAKKNGIRIKNELLKDFANKNKENFDISVSFQVLEHIADPYSFIQDQLSVLKPGGKIIISTPSEDTYLKYLSNNILNMPPHHVTRWPDKTFKFIARKFNCKMIAIYHEKLQNYHKTTFIKMLIENSILNNKILDNSLKRRLISKISFVLAKIIKPSLKKNMLPRGNSVVVVYEKEKNIRD
jgi:2-polyprenyl-3-methyl-5-hydroxy-6-metoxy-1,4-benzoquinol methylase